MPKYFFNGVEYDNDEIQAAADENGVSFEEYINKALDKGLTIEEDEPGNDLDTVKSSVSAGKEIESGESRSEDTSLVLEENEIEAVEDEEEDDGSGFFGAIVQGWKSGSLREDAYDEIASIMYNGGQGKDFQYEDFVNAVNTYQSADGIKEFEDWSKSYDKYKNKGENAAMSTLLAIKDEGIAGFTGVMVQSLAGLFSKEASAAGLATGATAAGVAGAVSGGAAALPAGIAGYMGGANALSESLITFASRVQEKLADEDMAFNAENVKTLLSDEEKFSEIRNTSLARGMTIGAIEGIATALSGGVGKAVGSAVRGTAAKTGRKIAGNIAEVATVGVGEMVGGAAGEAAGLAIEGKEMDAKEIIVEGIAGIGGAPVAAITQAPGLMKVSKYSINGENVSQNKVKEVVESATVEDLAGMDIKIERDEKLSKEINQKREDAVLEANIDSKVTEDADRAELFELEKERKALKGNDTRSAQTRVKELNESIDNITAKYRKPGRKSNVAKEKTAAIEETKRKIDDAIQKRKVASTVRFAEKEAPKLGLKVEAFDTSKGLKEQLKTEGVKLEPEDDAKFNRIGGFARRGILYINKEVAARTGQVSVGSHEILHPILNAMIGDKQEQGKKVAEFKGSLDEKTLGIVENSMNSRGYGTESGRYNTEYITVFSDLIDQKKIKYNENLFTKIGDFLLPIFRAAGFKKIKFDSGKDVYNFMREYSRSVEKGEISKDIVEAVGDVGGDTGILLKDPKKESVKTTEEVKEAEVEDQFSLDEAANEKLEALDQAFMNNEIGEDQYNLEVDAILAEPEAIVIPKPKPKPKAKREAKPVRTTDLGPNDPRSKEIMDTYNEGMAGVEREKYSDKTPLPAKLENKLIPLFEGYINKVVNQKFLQTQEEAFNKEDALSVLRAEVQKAIRTFNPKKNKDLAGYVKKYGVQTRQSLMFKDVRQEFTSDITEAKGVAVEESKTPQIEGESVERGQATFDQLDLVDDALINDISKELEREVKLRARKGTLSEKISVKRGRKTALVPWIEEFLNKKLFKTVLKRWGAIGEKNGQTKIPGAYIDFLNDKKNFDIIMKALPVQTIKKSYSKLFNIEQVGREITPEGNPIFRIKPIDKKTFLQYFLDGKKTTILERQKQLAREIITPVIKETIASYATVDNLTDIKAIRELAPSDSIDVVSEIMVEAQLNEIESQLDRYKNEDKSFDQIQFSFSGLEKKKIYDNSRKVARDEQHLASQEFLSLPEKIQNFIKNLAKNEVLKGKTFGGLIYEKLTTKDINDYSKEAEYKVQAIEDGEAGYDSTKPDIQVIVKDNKGNTKTILIEAKQSAAARFGQISLGFENGKVILKRGGKKLDPSEIPGGYDLIAAAEKGQKYIENILAFLSKKEKQEFTTFPLGKSISPKTVAELKQKRYYKSLQKLAKETSGGLQRVIDHYNAKGVYYIQIGGKGLYFLGQDVDNIGVPAFNADFVIGLRLKDSTPRSTGRTTLSLVSEPRIKNTRSLKASTINLNNKKGVKAFGEAATEIQFSIDLSQEFNEIIETKTGVKAAKTFSDARAQVLGAKKGKFKWLVPPGAEDFVGLMYTLIGKSKKGEQQKAWLKQNLLDPYADAINKFESYQQVTANKLKTLRRKVKTGPAQLDKKNSTGFTNEDAIRVWIWDRLGYDIPGIDKQDIKDLTDVVNKDRSLSSFGLQILGSVNGYAEPSSNWLGGNITTDVVNMVNTSSRAEFLKDWKENKDIIFSKENMNKLEAEFGSNYREQLSDMLYRMEFGRSRPTGENKYANRLMNWINDSVATIMFFNTRSALLQQLSIVNFLNFEENNPIAAAKAFGDQKQFWKDFSMLFNSDFLKQRRTGLKTDVNANIIIQSTSGATNKMRAAYQQMVKIGFLPTTMSDSFAIAAGGASFYRNNVNKNIENGMSKVEAEKQAFLDFQEIAEETQQSSRPDRVSNQQASPLGRLILAFANTPMQMARLSKKALLDLINGRGDTKANVAKLAYYSVLQNIIFATLQNGLMFMLFDDDSDEEQELDKEISALNSVADSLLRGMGLTGAIVSTAKNIIIETIKQSEKPRPQFEKAALQSLSLSPPLNSKVRKALSAARAFSYKNTREQMKGYSLDNPAYLAGAQIVSAAGNIPLDRLVRKLNNLKTMSEEDVKTYQAIALALGYSEWDLGLMESQKKKKKTKKKEGKTTMVNRGGEFYVKEFIEK
jgi:hypothetical protein